MTSSAAVAWIRSSDAVPRIVGRAPKHLSSWRTGRAGTSVGDGAADSVAGSAPGGGLVVDRAVDGPRDGVADSGVEPSWLHADTAITHTAAASHRLITRPLRPLEGLTSGASGHLHGFAVSLSGVRQCLPRKAPVRVNGTSSRDPRDLMVRLPGCRHLLRALRLAYRPAIPP